VKRYHLSEIQYSADQSPMQFSEGKFPPRVSFVPARIHQAIDYCPHLSSPTLSLRDWWIAVPPD
jgi:hypothetical protein